VPRSVAFWLIDATVVQKMNGLDHFGGLGRGREKIPEIAL
jgi:hypothetical protein